MEMAFEDKTGSDQASAAVQDGQPVAACQNQANEPQRELTGIAAYEEELSNSEPVSEEQVMPLPADTHERLPGYLMKIVDARITAWVKLLSLENTRKKLRKHCTDRKITDELSRQDREVKRVPDEEQLKQTRTRLKKQFEDSARQLKEHEAECTTIRTEALEKAQLEGTPLNNVQIEFPPMPVPRHLPLALQVGMSQLDILLQRNRIALRLPEAANPVYQQEPLWRLTDKHDINAVKLYEWLYLALGIEKRIAEYREEEKRQRDIVLDWKNSHAKHSFLKRDKNEEEAPEVDPKLILKRQAAERELASIEMAMVNSFWEVHEELAWLYVSTDLADEEQMIVRAFLRYGVTSCRKDAIQPDKLGGIYRLCQRDIEDWENSSETNHIVYPDEFYKALYERKATPSPDEELELNNRHSEEWRADRIWRQYIVSNARQEIFAALEANSEERVKELEIAQADFDKKLSELRLMKDSKSKKKRQALEEQMMDVRMKLGREHKIVDLLREKIIPDLRENLGVIKNRLDKAEEVMGMEFMIRREAKFIRRMARLLARLKEPFFPFITRDYLELDRPDHHCRDFTLEVVTKLEKADSRIYDHVLMTHSKLDKRITVRTPAVHLLIPCRGQMAMSISPRRSNDFGRLVMPLLAQRQGILETLLCDIMADFRWDCSMEEAGIDWLMADALCAGYATVRWDYRKKNEQTQKRAGIEKKSKDRQNFRAHYKLYVLSMEENGKKLFQKCLEIYQVCTKYIGLPPGKTALRRD